MHRRAFTVRPTAPQPLSPANRRREILCHLRRALDGSGRACCREKEQTFCFMFCWTFWLTTRSSLSRAFLRGAVLLTFWSLDLVGVNNIAGWDGNFPELRRIMIICHKSDKAGCRWCIRQSAPSPHQIDDVLLAKWNNLAFDHSDSPLMH